MATLLPLATVGRGSLVKNLDVPGAVAKGQTVQSNKLAIQKQAMDIASQIKADQKATVAEQAARAAKASNILLRLPPAERPAAAKTLTERGVMGLDDVSDVGLQQNIAEATTLKDILDRQKPIPTTPGMQLRSPTGKPVGEQTPFKPDTLSREAFEQQKALRGAGSAPSTTVNIGAENAFGKEVATQNAKQFFERRQAALDARDSLVASSEAKALLDSGAITGFGANFALGFGKVLQQAGINIAEDAIANTEAFVAGRAQEVGRIIELFGAGTGLSDADREFAQKAAAGNITMTEPSIRRILDINERASANVIRNFNRDADAIDPKLSPFPLRVEAPKAVAQRVETRPPGEILKELNANPSPERVKEIERELDALEGK